MFSFGPAPLADNAHREVTILYFVLMSVAEENELREDQEYRDAATHITPSAVKLLPRECPPIPKNFDSFERLLRWYIQTLLILFGKYCPHYLEVIWLQQEIMMMYRRNAGSLLAAVIAGLIWDLVTDTAQYFYTFPTEIKFQADPQEEISTSNLAVQRSLLLANIHISSSDTPSSLIPRVIPHAGYSNRLGLTKGVPKVPSSTR